MTKEQALREAYRGWKKMQKRLRGLDSNKGFFNVKVEVFPDSLYNCTLCEYVAHKENRMECKKYCPLYSVFNFSHNFACERAPESPYWRLRTVWRFDPDKIDNVLSLINQMLHKMHKRAEK